MSAGLIAFVTLLYIGVSVSFWFQGKPGMSICFLGYSIANIGIIMDTYK